MSSCSMEHEDYKIKLSDALSAKTGKAVTIESKGLFGPWNIVADGALKIVSSSSYEGVPEEEAADELSDYI